MWHSELQQTVWIYLESRQKGTLYSWGLYNRVGVGGRVLFFIICDHEMIYFVFGQKHRFQVTCSDHLYFISICEGEELKCGPRQEKDTG